MSDKTRREIMDIICDPSKLGEKEYEIMMKAVIDCRHLKDGSEK